MTDTEQLLDYEPEVKKLEDASNGKRFVNYLLDMISFYLLSFIAGIFLAFSEGGNEFLNNDNAFLDYLFGWTIMFIYYVSIEGLTGGKSVGKYITKTRVVTEEGEVPSFGTIVGRTFCRFIPFEAFSFLGEKPGGWHDSISKTRVVLD